MAQIKHLKLYSKNLVRKLSFVCLPKLRVRSRGIYVHDAGHDEDDDEGATL